MISWLIIVACTLVLVLTTSKHKGISTGIFCLCTMLYVVLMFMPIEDLQKVGFLNIIQLDNLDVDRSATFKLESAVSYAIKDEFIVTKNTSKTQIADWLDSQTKTIWVYIIEGDEYLWKKNMGVPSAMEKDLDKATEIYELYNAWQSSGELPVSSTRIEFGKFYIVR